jgi:hypothetical protein
MENSARQPKHKTPGTNQAHSNESVLANAVDKLYNHFSKGVPCPSHAAQGSSRDTETETQTPSDCEVVELSQSDVIDTLRAIEAEIQGDSAPPSQDLPLYEDAALGKARGGRHAFVRNTDLVVAKKPQHSHKRGWIRRHLGYVLAAAILGLISVILVVLLEAGKRGTPLNEAVDLRIFQMEPEPAIDRGITRR